MIARPKRRGASRLTALRALLLLGALATANVRGDTPLEPIEFLPIGVPRGRLSELGLKALPVNRKEFENRIQELNAKHLAMTDPVGTRIISSVYTARLVGDALVDGSAVLQIKHALPEPGYVTLEPLGFAVQALRWSDADNPRVEVGRAAGQDLVVSVEKDDALRFDWSLRGYRNRESVLQFDLALPDAAINELILDVPDSYQPRCSHGMVSRMRAEGPAADATEAEGFRRWRIELGASTNATCQVVPNDRADEARPFVTANSSRSYGLAASGLDFREVITLRTTHELRRLTLDADPGLRVGTVTVDGQSVDLTKRESGPGQERTYDLAFREPISGQAELIVTAFAGVVFDDPWTLPATTLRDTVWSTGVMRLEVRDTKLVRRLRSVGSRLRVTVPLAAPRQGDAFDFDLLRPDGSCEVVIRRTEREKSSRLLTSIRLRDSSVTARVTAELSGAGPPAFKFLLRRNQDWVIDSIETIPAEALQGQIVRGSDDQTREIRLAQAATSEAPVRIVVRARRGLKEGEALLGTDLRPIAFADTRQESNIVAVTTEAPLQLETSGDANLERVTTQSLSTKERTIFALEESAFLYRDGPEADELKIVGARTLPRFNSRARVSATVESEALRVEYLLQCEPIASQLSKLLVRFSAPVPGAIQWTIVGDRAGTVRARPAAASRQSWELTLPRSRSVSFDLRATATIPLADAFPIPLVSLPQADTQAGTLTIGTNDGTQLAIIEQRGLKAIPISSAASPQHTQTQGAFRYAPSQDVFVGVQPISRADFTEAWVQRARLTSRLDASGLIAHDLQLQVQNFGADHITLELPPDAFGRGVVIDERSLLWPDEVATLTVPLPPEMPTVVVRLRYDQQVRCGVFTKLQPLLPGLSVACLDWRWSVWLPPGVQTTRDSRLAAGRYPRPPTWDERLFGYSLLRRQGKPSSILEPAAWLSIFNNTQTNNQIRSAESCLATIDATLKQKGLPNDSLSWGELLGDVVQSAEHSLWIDQAGLAEVGISAATRLPPHAAADTSAAWLLQESNLLLVATRHGVVLTTLLSQSRGAFGRCVEGSDRILSSVELPGSVQLVAADSWLRTPATFNESLAAAATSPLDPALVGWTNVSMQVSRDNTSPLTVYEQGKISGFAWASFFLTLGLVVWLGGRNTALVFGGAVVTAVVTLFVAEPFVFVCRAMFLAVAAGGLLLLLRATGRRAAASTDDSLSIRLGGSAVIATSLLVLLATLIAMTARHALAQDAPAEIAERFGRLFEVYYAIDDENKPVDNNYHVPVEFDQALKELEFQLTAARAPWLLEACDFSVTLESNTDGVQLRSMQVDCELTTSSADETQITLPLRQDEVQLVEATVDDRYVYRDWSNDGESLELVVEGATRYRLRMSIRPQIRTEAERQGFDIRIPSLPTSRLVVRGLNPDQVDVPNRAGLFPADAVGPELVAELGSLPRLVLTWKADTQAVEVADMLNVTQRVWLRPETGLVTLEGLFAFTVVSGRLEKVALEADPRLRLLSVREGLPVERVDVQRGSRQEITLTLDRTYRSGERVMLPLSFVLPRDSAPLTLTGPLVRPRDLVPDEDSVGVSSPTGIHAELTAPGSAEIEGSQFAAAWGSMQVPEQALQLGEGADTWSLRLAQRSPRITTVEEAQLVVGRRHASIDYRADLEVTEYRISQLELQTPATFEMSDVRIIQEQVDLVRRWFTDGEGVTTVLLSRPLIGVAEVSLQGAMDLQDSDPLAFAGLRISAAETADRTIRILRKPQVLLDVQSHPGFELLETNSVARPLPKSGRLVAALKEANDEKAEPIVLRLQPNAADFSASLTTTMRPAAPAWRVEADLSIKVTSGVLDVLRWRLPRELADGVSIDPPYPYEVQTVAGQAEVLLVVTPPEPVTTTLDLHLQAALGLADGGRVSAPNIEVLDATELDRFLVLPLRSGREEIEWSTRGLDRPVWNDQKVTYHVRDARMRATIRDERRPAGAPRVLLAETRIEWRRDGSYAGLVHFDLAPGGESSFELRVPPRVKIVYLQTAGLSSPIQDAGSLSAAGGKLQVPVAIERLPQRLSVLFSGRASNLATPYNGRHLQVPSIENVDVEKTLWSIQRVNVDDHHQPLLAHASRTTQHMQTIRHQQIQAALQLGEQVAAQHRTDDFTTWRTAWTQRLKQTTGSRPTEASNDIALGRLQSAGLGYLASSFGSAGAGVIHCELDGAAPSLTLIEPSGVSSGLLTRMLVALAISSSLLLLFLARSWQPFWIFLARWPQLAGVAFGLAWWLFLTPSILGWLVVAISLLSVVRPVVRVR